MKYLPAVKPFSYSGTIEGCWDKNVKSVDGTDTSLNFTEGDVAEVLYEGSTGDGHDGKVAAVFKLRDGRYAAYETLWGPTGNGFCEDAYGGDAILYFASNLQLLVNEALTDEGRRLCGVPTSLWNE